MIRRLLAALVRWARDDTLLDTLERQERAATEAVARLQAEHPHRELHPLETGWYADGPERR